MDNKENNACRYGQKESMTIWNEWQALQGNARATTPPRLRLEYVRRVFAWHAAGILPCGCGAGCLDPDTRVGPPSLLSRSSRTRSGRAEGYAAVHPLH